jgi:transcriptional regulator with XRE-family HTH domain
MSVGKQDLISSRFGQAVRQLRDELGISQEELAARCSLHRTYLAGIESGRRNPSLKSIIRLATGLGTTASQLFQCFESIGGASPRPRKQR